MLRTNQAVYKIGDKVRLETFSTKQRGAVYVDVVKDGQTLVTRALDISGGRGDLSLDLTPAMFGTVEIRAYQITSDADPISDRRLIYVDPADDLKVEVSAEQESYKPGDDACVHFRVTDQAGRPVSAALGVEIVDEAVFALSDKQPGFEKVFMYLEKELLTPRYEVHQFSFEKVLLDDFEGEKPLAQRERAAQVLLAAAGAVRDKDVRAEFGREGIEAKRAQYASLYLQRLYEKAQPLVSAMTSYFASNAPSPDGFNGDLQSFAAKGKTEAIMLADPWGNALIGDGRFDANEYAYLTLRSMGPDGRDKTADDIAVGLYAQRRPDVQRYGAFKGKASVQDEAIAGGRVAIEGVVKDKTGAAVSRVRVAARRVSNGATIWVYTDSQGRFVIPNLAPGNYHEILESDSFQSTIYRTLALEAGSRGTVEAVLQPRGAAPITLRLYGRSVKGGGMDLAAPLEMNVGGARRKDLRAQFGAVGGVANGAPMPMAEPASVMATAGNAGIVVHQSLAYHRWAGPRIHSRSDG
jgi:hypothetical protein